MPTELSYNQFRSAHKGTTKSELSNLWTQYKAGDYIFPAEEAPEPQQEETVAETIDSPEEVLEEVIEEGLTVEEEITSQNKIAEMVDEEHPTLLTEEPKSETRQHKTLDINEACKEFDRLRTHMKKFAWKYKGDVLEEGRVRMVELANQTLPKNYSCTPTDSWKIWFGPTATCLLINTTNLMGFRVTRSWWQEHYQTTIYVDRELLPSNDLIVSESTRLLKLGKFVPRTPLVGIECKLPQGVKDIQMRGGQAGDY